MTVLYGIDYFKLFLRIIQRISPWRESLLPRMRRLMFPRNWLWGWRWARGKRGVGATPSYRVRKRRGVFREVTEGLEHRVLPAASLIKELGPASQTQPTNSIQVNGITYFALAKSGSQELWRSDGTEEGTLFIKSFLEIGFFSRLGNTLYFSARDAASGRELWKSDGTTAGTELVKDISPGPTNSVNGNLTSANNILYFSANATQSGNGTELWRSDGTTAGTFMVKDLYSGLSSSSPTNLTNVNGTLYFSAVASGSSPELWKSDGTSAGTVMADGLYVGSSSPSNLRDVDGVLYFSATGSGGGYGVWKSDGSSAPTLIKGGFNLLPSQFTSLNGRVYFTANTLTSGTELWSTDGTEAGTTLLKDIVPGSNTSGPSRLQNISGTLYFILTAYGQELWRSDGTAEGTTFVKYFNDSGQPINSLVNYRGLPHLDTNRWYSSDGTDEGTALLLNTAIQSEIYLDSGAGIFFLKMSPDTSSTVKQLWKYEFDAPVLEPSGSLSWGTITNTIPPETNSGILLKEFLNQVPGMNADLITDPSENPLEGIAAYSTSSPGGVWQYSLNGGASWFNLDAATEQGSRLLPGNSGTRLRFLPNAGATGPQSLSFRAWDRTLGIPGGTIDATQNGGFTSLSLLRRETYINVLSVNSAPVLNVAGNPSLLSVPEDWNLSSNLETGILDLIASMAPGGGISDPDSGAWQGIAITGANTSKGSWGYTTNGGQTWQALGSVSDSTARLLLAGRNTRIRFYPKLNVEGTLDEILTFRAWDGSIGINGGTGDASINGGTSPFSVQSESASITILPVNDAPTGISISSQSFSENVPVGTTLAVFGVTDIDAVDSFTYSIVSGPSDLPVGIVGNELRTIAPVDFEQGKFSGLTRNLGNLVIKVTDSGGLSVQKSFAITLRNENDPPVFLQPGATVSWGSQLKGTVGSRGALVKDFLVGASDDLIYDDDLPSLRGMAISGTDGTEFGTWEYSLNGVDGWTSLAGVSESSARLLSADLTTRIRFVQASGVIGNGTPGLIFRAWDRSVGNNGGTANVLGADPYRGAFSSISIRSELALISSNNAPVMKTSGNPLFTPDPADQAAGRGLGILELIDRMGPDDAISDAQGLMAEEGVAIIGASSSHGTWEYSLDGGAVWQSLGNVSPTSARLLTASVLTRIRFTPDAGFSGYLTDILSFRAWDQTSGVNSGLADTSVNGGTSPFSTTVESASGIYYENRQIQELTNLPENPFPGIHFTYNSTPVLVDLDADGDLDLFAIGTFLEGVYDKQGFFYFKNTGTSQSPKFELQTGNSNPFLNSPGFPDNQAFPNFVDLDRDHDLDLIIAGGYGWSSYYINSGTASQPQFGDPADYMQNPLRLISNGNWGANAFGDLDGDGDLDLVRGNLWGSDLTYFRNYGTPTSPNFVYQYSTIGSAGSGLWDSAIPVLLDLDGDGDLDLLFGTAQGYVGKLVNQGTPANPLFSPPQGEDKFFGDFKVDGYSSVAPGDLDGDGDLDLIVGSGTGEMLLVWNVGTNEDPILIPPVVETNPVGGIDFGDRAVPAAVSFWEYSQPELQGIAVGKADGTLDFLLGNSRSPDSDYSLVPQNRNPLAGIDVGMNAVPAMTYPWRYYSNNADPTPDLIVGADDGRIHYFANTSTFSTYHLLQFSLTEWMGSQNPFDAIDVGTNSAPIFIDLDGGDDLELIVGNGDGQIQYFKYRIVGSGVGAYLEQIPVSSNPFAGIDVGTDAIPRALDFDKDGDLDVLIGSGNGTFVYLQNTGDMNSPVFVEAPNPFGSIDVGQNAAPLILDRNQDGFADLLAGRADGTFAFFQTMPQSLPSYQTHTGVDNPLQQIPADFTDSYSFGDLDGDGDLDLILGQRPGSREFRYYRNVGSPTEPNYELQTGANIPFAPGQYSDLTQSYGALSMLIDYDNDGDLDLLVGSRSYSGSSRIYFYPNIGTAQQPRFVDLGESVFVDTFYGLDSWTSGDLDGDGDYDLILSEENNGVTAIFNVGTKEAPDFQRVYGDASEIPGLSHVYSGYFTRPCLDDFDRDGDLDLIVSGDGGFGYYENQGTRTNPRYVRKYGEDNPFNDIPLNNVLLAVLVDLDADGDLDLAATLSDYTSNVPMHELAFLEAVMADLSLDVSRAGTGVVHVGDDVVYTVTLSNSGPDEGTDTVVAISLPTGLTGVSFAPEVGSYQQGGWVIPALASGNSVTLTIRGKVATNTIGQTLSVNAEIVVAGVSDPDSVPNNRDPLEDDQGSASLYVNTAPVLNDAGNPLLTTIPQGLTQSANLGTLVSDLIARMSPGGWITDADPGALQGIAINGMSGTGTGIWQYSLDGGTTWLSVAATGNSNARLLAADATTRIRYIANTSFLGEAKISFVAWDRTAGVNGGTANVASRGGSTPFSLAYEYATQQVVNTAPILDASGSPSLDSITQNVPDAINPGTLVASLISRMAPLGGITDPNPLAVKGIAINGLGGTTTGVWEYTVNNGVNWAPIGTTGNTNARLLAADANTRIRYRPNAGFIGEAKIAFVAWDRTTGANGGVANVTQRGGTTAYSLAYDYASIFVLNTAPVLNAGGNPLLDSIPANIAAANNPGLLVTDLIARMIPGGGISDSNPGALRGIAINGLGGTSTGVWEYSVNNGTNWSPIGTTGNSNARLLAADSNTRIRYRPNSGFIGEAKMAFVAWDQTSGSNGGVANVTQRGGTTPYSLAYEYASIFVLNSAPVLNAGGNPQFDAILQNIPSSSNSGMLVTALIARMNPGGGISDSDPGALQGIAINGMTGTTKGVWEFSINGGTNWAAIGSTGNINARLLAADANTRIRYQPNVGYIGDAMIAFVAWDRTSGVNGGITNASERGGSTPFSLAYETASIQVINSAPVLTPSNSAFLDSIAHGVAGQNSPGTLISDLIARMSPAGGITDPNVTALRGIAINGMTGTGQGRWQYTQNNGALWNTFQVTGNTTARLLAADANTRIRWFPDTDFTGTLTLSFTAWDQTKGANGGVADVTSRGGTTPYSLAYDYATLTVL